MSPTGKPADRSCCGEPPFWTAAPSFPEIISLFLGKLSICRDCIPWRIANGGAVQLRWIAHGRASP